MVQSGHARRRLLHAHTSHELGRPPVRSSLTAAPDSRKHTAKCIYQIRCHARSVHQMAYRTRNQMSEFKRSPAKDTVKVQLATALLHAAAAEWGFGTLR